MWKKETIKVFGKYAKNDSANKPEMNTFPPETKQFFLQSS